MASSSESHGTHDLNAATNPMTLSKEGLEAAHAAYAKTTGGMLEGHPMANAITAYLAALREPDGLVERLNSVTEEDAYARPWTFGQTCREAATVIQTLQSQLTHFGQLASDHRDELETRAEAAEQQVRDMREDAERYQYLRTRDLDTIEQGGVFAGMTPNNVVLNGDDLDVAIDAGRLALKNQESDRG